MHIETKIFYKNIELLRFRFKVRSMFQDTILLILTSLVFATAGYGFLQVIEKKILHKTLNFHFKVISGFLVYNALIIYGGLIVLVWIPNFFHFFSMLTFLLGCLGTIFFFFALIKGIFKDKLLNRIKEELNQTYSKSMLILITQIIMFSLIFWVNPIVDSDFLNFYAPLAVAIYENEITPIIYNNFRLFGFPLGQPIIVAWSWCVIGNISILMIKAECYIYFAYFLFLLYSLGLFLFNSDKDMSQKFVIMFLAFGIFGSYMVITPHYPDLLTLFFVFTTLYFWIVIEKLDGSTKMCSAFMVGTSGGLAILIKYHALPLIIALLLMIIYKGKTRARSNIYFLLITILWTLILPFSTLLLGNEVYYATISVILLILLVSLNVKKSANSEKIEKSSRIDFILFLQWVLIVVVTLGWYYFVYSMTGLIVYPRPINIQALTALIERYETIVILGTALISTLIVMFIFSKDIKTIISEKKIFLVIVGTLITDTIISFIMGFSYITEIQKNILNQAIYWLTIGSETAGIFLIPKLLGMKSKKVPDALLIWFWIEIAFGLGVGQGQSIRYFLYILPIFALFILYETKRISNKLEINFDSLFYILFLAHLILLTISTLSASTVIYDISVIIAGIILTILIIIKTRYGNILKKLQVKVHKNQFKGIREAITLAFVMLLISSMIILGETHILYILDRRTMWFNYRTEGYDLILSNTDNDDVIFTVGLQGINLYTRRHVIDLFYSDRSLLNLTIFSENSSLLSAIEHINQLNIKMAIIPDGTVTTYNRFWAKYMIKYPYLQVFQNPLFFDNLKNIHQYIATKIKNNTLNITQSLDIILLSVLLNSTETIFNILGTCAFNRSISLGSLNDNFSVVVVLDTNGIFFKQDIENIIANITVELGKEVLLDNGTKAFQNITESSIHALSRVRQINMLNIFNFSFSEEPQVRNIYIKGIKILIKVELGDSSYLDFLKIDVSPVSSIYDGIRIKRIIDTDMQVMLKQSPRFNVTYNNP